MTITEGEAGTPQKLNTTNERSMNNSIMKNEKVHNSQTRYEEKDQSLTRNF